MSRFTAWMNVALIATIVALLIPTTNQALAQADDDSNTEDILYLADGRVLHGQIISETEDEVVFNITVNRKANLFAKMTFSMADIESIERDVSFDGQSGQAAKKKKTYRTLASSEDDTDKRGFGRLRASSDAEDVPSFYIVPMKGQMGTDINAELYKDLIEDIREVNPDYIIIEMKCQDIDDRLSSPLKLEEWGFNDIRFLDVYRDIVNIFRDDLRDIPQVMWIHDSMGISSVLATAWPNMYMKPEARFGGIASVAVHFDIPDEEVHAKYREAYMALLKGFALNGQYALEIIDAMVIPEYTLSASFKGREVIWDLSRNGEFLVDGNEKATVYFRSKEAEDLLISDGTAETFDDVALLVGLREYRIVDGRADEVVERYSTGWRRSLKNCKALWNDYGMHLGWASGDETLKWLGRAKRDIENILKAMNRYQAVEIRLGVELGLSKFNLTTILELLKEQIQALRRGQRGGGGGGGRRGGGGLGGG
ncbi:MAG: hypothetical protein IH984_06725 [Planctomycetes bacterium]|nr:hypothetical protein [Planctomycetota bacterium]